MQPRSDTVPIPTFNISTSLFRRKLERVKKCVFVSVCYLFCVSDQLAALKLYWLSPENLYTYFSDRGFAPRFIMV